MQKEIATTFIIFGGSGDLAQRKLYPALFNLYKRGLLQDHFAVIGTARRPWSHEYFRQIVIESITEDISVDVAAAKFASHFYYQSHDVTDTAHYLELDQLATDLEQKYQTAGNRIFYMAMSPQFFGTIAEHIHDQNLTSSGFNRLIIEKPFGDDLESATKLNAQINASFAEEDVYRIDHYLGKEMVQDILPLRFSNPIINSLWNSDNVQNVQITLSEQLGVEERGGYYETSGALRDMIQNHMFQIATQVAMGEPASLTAHDIHEKKQEVLESLVPLTDEEVDNAFVRGQYLGDGNTNAYIGETNVSLESTVETYAAGRITFEAGALANVPFYLRTGKRMAKKSSRIDLVLKNKTNLYPDAASNVVTIEIDPNNSLTLTLNGKKVLGEGVQQENLFYTYPAAAAKKVPEPYERLLADALNANRTNFTNWHEVRASWNYLDRVVNRWQALGAKGLYKYAPFKMGPEEATNIFINETDEWILK